MSDVIQGTARDAKGGAVVVADDGRVLYVGGLDGWPDGISGTRVVVTGQVVRKHHLPVAGQGPDGGWSQGVAAGGSGELVIADAKWESEPGD